METLKYNTVLCSPTAVFMVTNGGGCPTGCRPSPRPLPLREGRQVEIIWTRKLPPPPHWDRRAIQPNHIIFRSCSTHEPMWTPPINESALGRPSVNSALWGLFLLWEKCAPPFPSPLSVVPVQTIHLQQQWRRRLWWGAGRLARELGRGGVRGRGTPTAAAGTATEIGPEPAQNRVKHFCTFNTFGLFSPTKGFKNLQGTGQTRSVREWYQWISLSKVFDFFILIFYFSKKFKVLRAYCQNLSNYTNGLGNRQLLMFPEL